MCRMPTIIYMDFHSFMARKSTSDHKNVYLHHFFEFDNNKLNAFLRPNVKFEPDVMDKYFQLWSQWAFIDPQKIILTWIHNTLHLPITIYDSHWTLDEIFMVMKVL